MRQQAARLLSRRPAFPTRTELLHFTLGLSRLSMTQIGSNASIPCDVWRHPQARCKESKGGCRYRARTVMQKTGVCCGGGGEDRAQWRSFQSRSASCTCQSGTTWFSCAPLPLRSRDLGAGIGWLKPWMLSSPRLRCGIMGNGVDRPARRCVLWTESAAFEPRHSPSDTRPTQNIREWPSFFFFFCTIMTIRLLNPFILTPCETWSRLNAHKADIQGGIEGEK